MGKKGKKSLCIFNRQKICTNCVEHQRDYIEKPIDTQELINKPIGYRLVKGYNIIHNPDDIEL